MSLGGDSRHLPSAERPTPSTPGIIGSARCSCSGSWPRRCGRADAVRRRVRRPGSPARLWLRPPNLLVAGRLCRTIGTTAARMQRGSSRLFVSRPRLVGFTYRVELRCVVAGSRRRDARAADGWSSSRFWCRRRWRAWQPGTNYRSSRRGCSGSCAIASRHRRTCAPAGPRQVEHHRSRRPRASNEASFYASPPRHNDGARSGAADPERWRAVVTKVAERVDAELAVVLEDLPGRDRETLSRLISTLVVSQASRQGVDLFADRRRIDRGDQPGTRNRRIWRSPASGAERLQVDAKADSGGRAGSRRRAAPAARTPGTPSTRPALPGIGRRRRRRGSRRSSHPRRGAPWRALRRCRLSGT